MHCSPSCPRHDECQCPESVLSQYSGNHRHAGEAEQTDDRGGSTAMLSREIGDPIETLVRQFHEPAIVDFVVDDLFR